MILYKAGSERRTFLGGFHVKEDMTQVKLRPRNKTWLAVLLAALMLLSGCNFGSSQSAQDDGSGSASSDQSKFFLPLTGSSQQEAPGDEAQNPAVSPQTTIDDWRQIYRAAGLLSGACDQMFDTYLQFQIEEIDLGKAQNELNLEAEYTTAAEQALRSLPDLDGTAQPFKARLEADLSTLNAMLAHREAVDLNSLDSTNILLDTCSALVDTQEEIASAAAEAGMSEGDLQSLEAETADVIAEMEQKIQAGR